MSAATIQQKMVPELRFSGFGSEWKKRHIGDMFKVVVGFVGTVSTEYCSQDVGVPFVRTLNVKDGYFSQEELQYVTRDFHDRNKKSQIFNGDILIARVGANMGLVCEVTNLSSEANSANVVIIKKNDELVSGFYSRYLSSDHGKKQTLAFGAGGAQEVLNIGVVKTMVVPEIELEEQQKIADFLGSVDAWLDNLRQQKTALETYKKGMMQKLFTQQIRFKDDNGNEFPEWKNNKFQDVFERVTTKNNGVCSTNVLTISGVHGLVSQLEYYNHNYASKDLSGYTLLQRDDFAYNKSHSNGYPIGAIKRLSKYDQGVVSPLYICFRVKSKNSQEESFWDYYFESGLFNREVAKIAQEGARSHGLLNVSVTDFFKDTHVQVPCSVEQQKIADFLLSLDRLTSDNVAEIKKVEQWKKGLMQKMFV
jgi:type I restriction enzyme S subunit